ncbi:hypothetical protein CLU79DRAFT_775168 [Phycomyces nitens]|nr:hypothetical protein CLU79DRAFT_775168 [Phycomyces nitens]
MRILASFLISLLFPLCWKAVHRRLTRSQTNCNDRTGNLYFCQSTLSLMFWVQY